ncbi:MAG TPA: hypothetical protein VJV05_03180 [Pyrinomonadaceae bacterium]|nr:hypothetical protein [Pyrinomonadaceae bacterium]
MKNSWPFLLLLALALGCGGNDSNTTVSSGSTATTTSSSPATPSKPAAKDISGSYEVSGTNESGGGAYNGTLNVKSRGDVYQFSWTSGTNTYDGVGVQTGNNVAVAFTEGADGKGCGVVLYSIGADGTLDGKAGYWGNNSSESETATRTSGTGLEGDYSVKGKNTQGQEYTGTLGVKKSGTGYAFNWKVGSSPLTGFGIQQGETVAVGIGGSKCGFVGYEVESDGTLDGKWGSVGSTSVGTETATKK